MQENSSESSWTRSPTVCQVASRLKSPRLLVTAKTALLLFQLLFHSAPAPVTEIQPVLDAENITLQWPRPDGRIDEYFIAWFPLDAPDDARAKNIPGDIETEGINRLVKVLFVNPQDWI